MLTLIGSAQTCPPGKNNPCPALGHSSGPSQPNKTGNLSITRRGWDDRAALSTPMAAARPGGSVDSGVPVDAPGLETSATYLERAAGTRSSRRWGGVVAGALEEAGDQGERGPVQAPVAGDGVGPQLDVWGGEGKDAHPWAGCLAEREQPDAQAGGDHVLHQAEAVCLVGDAGGEPGHGGERADDVLVCGVAGVADPVVGPVAGEDLQRRCAGGGFAARLRPAPTARSIAACCAGRGWLRRGQGCSRRRAPGRPGRWPAIAGLRRARARGAARGSAG